MQKAIQGVLANQSVFRLVRPVGARTASGDLWLDAYVTDFLTRAAEKGYDVPELARTIALDNLSNRLSYADDFTHGGEDIAYALYVLARAGRASLGDLRYYAETKIGNFGTALAKAQVGAALALYGDRPRAPRAFEAALADLKVGRNPDYWVGDYGSQLRDTAAVLTLAAESDVGGVDLRALAEDSRPRGRTGGYTSTQENAWMLLAAAALIKDARADQLRDRRRCGRRSAVQGVQPGDARGRAGRRSRTSRTDTLDAVIATTGVTVVPEPAGGNGFTIERSYYTVDGEPTDIAAVGQNERDRRDADTVTADWRPPRPHPDRRPDPRRLRDREPEHLGERRRDQLRLARCRAERRRTPRRASTVSSRRSTARIGDPLQYSVAYSMRAVSPGVFAQPAATVEDMYRPYFNARTATGTVEVVGPTR